MQKTLFIKLSIIATICVLFFVGLQLLSSLVADRQHSANTVVREIAKQHVNPQQIITPFIAIPTTLEPPCSPQAANAQNCQPTTTHIKTLLAWQTENEQTLNVSDDTYQRSVYHAISYNGDIRFKQRFMLRSLDVPRYIAPSSSSSSPLSSQVAASKQTAATESYNSVSSVSPESSNNAPINNNTPINNANATNSTNTAPSVVSNQPANQEHIHWDRATLILPISDLRGITALPSVKINGQNVLAQYPDTSLLKGLSYIEVPIPTKLLHEDTLDITIKLPLSGISNLSTVPTGQQYQLNMSSDWSAPYFGGQALPNTKLLESTGFKATWQNQYLALANNQRLRDCLAAANQSCTLNNHANFTMSTDSLNSAYTDSNEYYTLSNTVSNNSQNTSAGKQVKLSSFGVSFAEPNDVYLQTERTMKYALLLILVSFGTFFLFEVVKSARIHPIQYLLVGAALLIFYVLLLPLAEQVPFWQAYGISAVACVGLIGWYTYYVLGSVKRAGIFTLLLSSLYAGFYGILSSEEMNLLMGAVFCFVLLAGVMYATRKVDWYQVA